MNSSLTVQETMSSTENLLQDSGKSTNTLESGYQSDSNEADDAWHQKEKDPAKKKKSQRNLGLENKGFESDNEHVNTGSKHKAQVHRTLSENANTARQAATKKGHRVEKRRKSYAGRSSTDAIENADGATQNSGVTRRRSSAADEDLRRKACLNSMRLRRVSSSSQQPFSEVEMSVDDDVFYDYEFGTETRKKNQEFGYEDDYETHEKRREYAMGRVCSAVELENRQLNEYSRRLSSALEEKVKLEEELNSLRRAASISSLSSADENWKIVKEIHFRNEKLNSVRRKSKRNEDQILSFEQLRRIQMDQSRRLPKVPQSFSSGEYEFLEEIPAFVEKKVERLPQRKMNEEFPQHLEEKRRNERFKEEAQPTIEKKVQRLPQRTLSKDLPLHLEETGPVIESKVDQLPQRPNISKESHYSEETGRDDKFFLSELEKERRERKIADLAADLWKKLLQGEKFHGENELNHGKTSAETSDGTMAKGRSNKGKKNENSSSARMREKAQSDRIAKITEHSYPSTSGLQESQSKVAKDTTVMHSGSESNLAQTDAFRRNQRRPLRYKRGSGAAEALIRTSRSSTSRSIDARPEELHLVQDETHIPQLVQPEKSSTFQRVQPEKLGLKSTEVVGQNHSKWFDYMLPPGKRGNRKESQRKDPHEPEFPQRENAPAENAKSLQEKLRYYQELQQKRFREENSFDLADAYMAAHDTEDEKELRRQAAGKAAILRREASHLLWQAMDLERICDPNARVRHIFTPY